MALHSSITDAPLDRYEVIVLASGGFSRGFGNLYRCRELAACFWSAGQHCLLICDCPDVVQVFPNGSTVPIAAGNLDSLLGSARVNGNEGQQVRLLCIDDRACDVLTVRRLRKAFPLAAIVHLNDAGLADASEYDLVVDNSHVGQRANGTNVLPGLEYAIIRSDCIQYRPRHLRDIRSGFRELMLCLGSEDPGLLTEQVVVSLLECDLDTCLSIRVVCGVGFERDRVQRLAAYTKSRNVRIDSQPTHFAELLAEADMVVSLGGQTALEACCVGTTSLTVDWSWMTAQAQGLVESGISLALGVAGSAGRNLQRLLASPSVLGEVRVNGWRTIDGHGAGRLAAILWDRFG